MNDPICTERLGFFRALTPYLVVKSSVGKSLLLAYGDHTPFRRRSLEGPSRTTSTPSPGLDEPARAREGEERGAGWVQVWFRETPLELKEAP